MLSEMTRAEKAELLRWIVRDLADDFPGIESTPGVMGGVPCKGATKRHKWIRPIICAFVWLDTAATAV